MSTRVYPPHVTINAALVRTPPIHSVRLLLREPRYDGHRVALKTPRALLIPHYDIRRQFLVYIILVVVVVVVVGPR